MSDQRGERCVTGQDHADSSDFMPGHYWSALSITRGRSIHRPPKMEKDGTGWNGFEGFQSHLAVFIQAPTPFGA